MDSGSSYSPSWAQPKRFDYGADPFGKSSGCYLFAWHMKWVWNCIYICSMEPPEKLYSIFHKNAKSGTSRRYWNYVRDKRLQFSFFFLIDKSHMQLVGFELIISHPPPCSYKGREFHLSKSSLAEDHSMSSSSKHNKKYLNLGKILFKINFKQEQKWQPLHYGTSGW